VLTDVSEEHIAYIFRVEKISSEKTSVQAGGKQSSGFHVGFLLGLFFDLEDGGVMFLRNVG
jgi:hypothetical protein